MHRALQGLVAVVASWIVLVPSAPAALVADYQFNNNLQSSVGSPPDLQNVGVGNAFVADTVGGQPRTVLQFPMGGGVLLTPTSGVISSGIYTIVALFRFDEISGYRRIVDFKDPPVDKGLYSLDGFLNFFDSAIGASAVIPAATYVQVALTRDGSDQVVGYVNGAQQFAFLDSGNDGIIVGNTLRFFKDDGSEESAGAVSRIRLFDTALSAAEVAALERPNPAPALAPFGLVCVGGVLLAVGLRRLRNQV